MCTVLSAGELTTILVVAAPLAAAPVVLGALVAWRPTRALHLAAIVTAVALALLGVLIGAGGGLLLLLSAALAAAAALWGAALWRPHAGLRIAALVVAAAPLLFLAQLAVGFYVATPMC